MTFKNKYVIIDWRKSREIHGLFPEGGPWRRFKKGPQASRLPGLKVILLVANDDATVRPLAHVLSQELYSRIFVASNGFAAVKFVRYISVHGFADEVPASAHLVHDGTNRLPSRVVNVAALVVSLVMQFRLARQGRK